ncbi:MAG: hypothetical protein CL610_01620 [Anaerolineaceae bacterium]|nr:hypothetical protein [Anaerolineaceae bacterium]
MSTPRSDYWTELKTIHATTVLIEMTRFGLLWHGHAAKVLKGNQVDRNALAVAWGADKDQVYEDVLHGTLLSLEHRANSNQPSAKPIDPSGKGMFVMGCWRSFSGSPDRTE